MKKNLYEVLGVDYNANRHQIRKAFRILALKNHPDKNNAVNAQEQFMEIMNAFTILNDRIKRREYDVFLKMNEKNNNLNSKGADDSNTNKSQAEETNNHKEAGDINKSQAEETNNHKEAGDINKAQADKNNNQKGGGVDPMVIFFAVVLTGCSIVGCYALYKHFSKPKNNNKNNIKVKIK
ncbi:uncharacterized protein ACRADG_005278 [Cochliomyia hominivorax]